MDIVLFLIILLLIYLINPLKSNEEKIFTTPFLTISYIIILSYLISILNIPMYKYIYFVPLILVVILKIAINKNNIINNIKNITLSNIINKRHLVLLIILIFTLTYAYFLYPSNPANTVDTQYHSYKSKAIIEEKTIFYETDEIPYKYYTHYPSGFHSIVYFLSSKVEGDILDSIQFIKFYMIILFILGYYLIGESIKEGSGICLSFFMPLTNVVFRTSGVLLPNFLGYSLMLLSIYSLLQYRNTKNNIYLYMFLFITMSLVFTHTFPLIILSLFIVSLSIWDFLNKNYQMPIKYWVSYILSILTSVAIIYSKMAKDIVSYGKSVNYIPEPINKIVHNILSGLGIIYTYIWATTDKKDILDNINTFIISIGYTIFGMFGIYYLTTVKNRFNLNNGVPFILLLIFLILNIINIKFLHIYIPFFSNQYDTTRMAIHIQIIMPIFYGFGLFYILNKIKIINNNIKNDNKITNKLKKIIIIIILLFSLFTLYTNYTILKDRLDKNSVITNNDLKIFNYINKHNISNQTILNFGEDAGQFLPIYTKNKPTFTYYSFQSNTSYVGNVSWREIVLAVDNKNYSFIVNLCKNNNITYIFISDKLGKYDGGFFNNSKYFKILYVAGNGKFIKVK